MPNQASAAKEQVDEILSPEVERFAKSFSSEKMLQEKLETLFNNVPKITGVKILQGTQEYGKDLVFYEPGTCGEKRLIACVVKNKKITGAAGSDVGATTVMNQVRQAIDNPYTSPSGTPEYVNHVYVMCPWPCSQEAMNSIKGGLERERGRVEFVCGKDLFDLFFEHLKSYILLESNLLTLYLTSLHKLDENSAFANLMMRGGFVLDGVASLRNVYIPQHFRQWYLSSSWPSRFLSGAG